MRDGMTSSPETVSGKQLVSFIRSLHDRHHIVVVFGRTVKSAWVCNADNEIQQAVNVHDQSRLMNHDSSAFPEESYVISIYNMTRILFR